MTHRGPMIQARLGRLVPNYIDSLKHTYEPRVGPPKVANLLKYVHDKNSDWLLFPRSALYELEGFEVRDIRRFARSSMRAQSRDQSCDFLYDDQQTIAQYICDQLRNTICASMCLDLRAGYGKTFIAAACVAKLRARTLYIVPTRELARQVARDFNATLCSEQSAEQSDTTGTPEQNYETVIAQSSAQLRDLVRNSSANVIAVINTVVRLIDTGGVSAGDSASDAVALDKHFALIIYDEAHSYCNGIRTKVFNATQARWVLGLSATVAERRDGMDFSIAHYFGRIVRAEDIPGFAYDDTQRFDLQVRAIKYDNPEARNLVHESTGTVFAHYMYEQFAQDSARNDLILDNLRELIAEGHNVFVFAEERAHIEYLAHRIIEARIVSASECAIFYGGISRETRAQVLESARVICATYSYSGTGISIVRMTAAILATPRYSNMKQIIGRILRRGSDPTIPRVVVDIIDTRTCLAHQYRFRKNVYKFYQAR